MWQAFIAELVRAREVPCSTLNESMVEFGGFITCDIGMSLACDKVYMLHLPIPIREAFLAQFVTAPI